MSRYSTDKRDGRPTRILAGTADRLNKALQVLGIDSKITQTEKSLKIDGQNIQAIRSYTYKRSSDFDSKVTSAIRSLLSTAGYDVNSQNASHSVIRKGLEELIPAEYLITGRVTAEHMAEYAVQAQAVLDYCTDDDVKKSFAHNDALNSLFDRNYDEVIME